VDKTFHVVILYLLIYLSLIFFMYPSQLISSSKDSYWLPIFVQIVIHFFMLTIFLKGLSFFPKEDIITIFKKSNLFILIFLLPIFSYLFMTYLISIMAYTEIINIIFLSKTPVFAVLLLIIFTSTYIASKGIDAIFRTGILIAFFFIPIIIFTLALSYQNMDWHYILPLQNKNFSFLIDKQYLSSFFAISGGFIWLGFIHPQFHFKKNKIVLTFILTIPCYFLSVYIPILIFGSKAASTFVFPFVIAVDTINITWLMFDRITIFLLLSLMTFNLLFISLILWQLLQMVHAFFPKWKTNYLLLLFSSLGASSYYFAPNYNDTQFFFNLTTVLRFFIIFVVPISLYILGKRKKRLSK